MTMATRYLGTPASYRQCVRHEGMPIMYPDPDQAPAVAPSSVWRWLSWLGRLNQTARAAMRLIRNKDPGCTLHREPWSVSPAKHRSQQRRETLERAMKLLATNRLFSHLFGKEIFPHLATAQGWR